jgi:hypothetical protein
LRTQTAGQVVENKELPLVETLHHETMSFGATSVASFFGGCFD